MGFSVLILTLNEEAILPNCLNSVRWCDDVVVLDSFSDDSTVEIARQSGARVYQRRFTDFGDQRNHALETIDFKHPWVFHLDADEAFSPALLQECMEVVGKDSCSGYLVPSRTVLFGKVLRHAADYPVYQVRLMKRGELRFEQCGHGQRECAVERGLGVLRQPYTHFAFTHGLHRWFGKHNDYSTQEAERAIKIRGVGLKPDRQALVSKPSVAGRRFLKDLSFRVPGRPVLRFLYHYVLRLGFLDGRAGFVYSALYSVYELMVDLKMAELDRRQKQLPI